MTIVMRCDEKDRLVGYLYDECSAAERSAVEAHLSRCAVVRGRTRRAEGCADAPGRLERAARRTLASVSRVSRSPPDASHRTWTLPAWAQAAAAVLVLAAGAGLANLQIEYGSGG